MAQPAHPLRLAARALASAVSFGVMIVTVTVLTVDLLRPGAADRGDLSLPFYALALGTASGIGSASLVTWRLLAAIASDYRRGGLAIVAGFATVVLMLVTVPAHRLGGRGGLVGLAALCALASLLFARSTRRTAEQQ